MESKFVGCGLIHEECFERMVSIDEKRKEKKNASSGSLRFLMPCFSRIRLSFFSDTNAIAPCLDPSSQSS
jgi:hypothetical protein